MGAWLMLAGLAALLVWIVFSDLRHRRIPNAASAAVAILGLGYSYFAGGAVGLGLGAATALVGGAVLLVCRWITGPGALGLGDVKLGAALGPWLGPAGLMVALAMACALVILASPATRKVPTLPFAPFLAAPALGLAILGTIGGTA